MRTKRKDYDYNSSDYGNEDYGQQDYEEDDYDQEDPGDSEFEGHNQRENIDHQGNKSNVKSSKRNDDYQESEDSQESDDEDPFSPEIELILNDKQVPSVAATAQIALAQPSKSASLKSQTSSPQMWFLVKFADQSFLHVKWMEESELEEYSYKAKQKIRRYWIQKEKKQRIKEYQEKQKIEINQKNHHFSEDEEEDEFDEALIKDPVIIPDILISNANQYEESKQIQVIPVKDASGEDLTQYFDKNFVVVERILSTTLIFPVIHPRQAKQIKGKWQEDCLKAMSVLINFRKNNLNIGLSFAEQFDQENEEQSDYFKVVKQPIDFMMILNRLYNKFYTQPLDFWNDLGQVFKNCRMYFKNPKSGMRKQCNALRCLAYYLYKDWHNEQKIKLQTNNPWATVKNPDNAQPPIQKQQSFVKEETKPAVETKVQTQYMEKDATVVNLQSLLLKNSESTNTSAPFQAPNNANQSQKQNPGFQNYGNMEYQNPQNVYQHQQQQQNDLWNNLNQQKQSSQNLSAILPSLQNVDFSNHQQTKPYSFQQTLPKLNQIDPTRYGIQQSQQPQQQMQDYNQMNSFQNQLNSLMNNQANKLITKQDSGQQFQLPGISQFQPSLSAQQNQMNQFNLALETQKSRDQLLSQILGNQPQQQQNSQFSQPQMRQQNLLPSINQIGQLTSQFQHPGLQLPSLSQYSAYNQQLGDSQSQSMGMQNNLLNLLNEQEIYNQLQNLGLNQQNQKQNQQQMNMFYEYQNMLNQQLMQDPLQQLQMQQPQFAFNQLGFPQQYDQQRQLQNQFGNMLTQDTRRGLQFQQQYPSNQYSQMQFSKQPQESFISQNPYDPMFDQMQNQNDNLDNDRNSDPVVPPAIYDAGAYDLSWFLEKGESLESVLSCFYITIDEIDNAVNNKNNVDQLYLIKWKNLSYTQSTWEPESIFKDIYKEKTSDYMRFNRSLDQIQRERLDQLIKNHKKMLRLTEKKQSHRKIDKIQESIMTSQESKFNRQLLNIKITELMGNSLQNFVQYNENKGIVPSFKQPHLLLKDYQTIGVNWLIRAWHEHRNVVLADEMGLGKTIMTLALFEHLARYCKLKGPFLILAPLTTLEHWKRIADEWTSLNSVLYYDQGGAEGRQKIREWEWFFTDVTYKGTITQKSELFKFNILITSFEVFMQDLNPILQEIPFIYIVVDEAHRLKNKQAKTLKLLKDHPCKRILLLTGTPVQNNTKELWTLLNYIEPEKFNSLDMFLTEFGNLETYEQIQRLHLILKPHFLRRLKEEVDKSIPPLQETVIEVGLTKIQNIYYKGIYGDNKMILAKFGTNSVKTSQLNNIDIQLRKCCNHLFLLKGVEEELLKDCRTEVETYEKILQSSGKLILLDKFIEKFRKENHKMLIFSQFKKMLDILELYLRMKGLPYEMLTGSVKTQDRISAIQRFNDDKNFGVFLLTTRAGGLGINLTSARVVIIFDSDWNPQNDLQAIARAHRIGQKFEVQVYRLITAKTYEEQMFEKASKKLGMEQALFSKGAFNTNDAEISGLTLRGLAEMKQDAKDIENLLKFGAYAFIDNDENEEEKNQFNKDIDEILATGKKKEFTYNKGIYTLNKSTFNASKYEKLPDVNDPEFWNKVLPYDSLISINTLEKKLKKEKKEIGQSEKLQKEFIKDFEIVFNDYMECKFEGGLTQASKKQLEADEEKVREVLKKLIKISGLKLIYVEKCKEWMREMLRTNKRSKKAKSIEQQEVGSNEVDVIALATTVGKQEDQEEDDVENFVEEDDIMMDDSDEDQGNIRKLRKRVQKQPEQKQSNDMLIGKRGRRPASDNAGNKQNTKVTLSNIYNEDKEGEQEDEDDAGQENGSEYDEEVMDDDDDDYINSPLKSKKGYPQGKYEEQKKAQQEDDDYDDKQETRYGLRGRKKYRSNKDEGLVTGSKSQIPKISEQFVKRNQKNGIVCSECLKPEPPICNWICNGYCQRFFHDECKNAISQRSKNQISQRKQSQNWQCSDCIENVATCFCCKVKGQILLFPKKGKPKTADQLENDGQVIQPGVKENEVATEQKDNAERASGEEEDLSNSDSANKQEEEKQVDQLANSNNLDENDEENQMINNKQCVVRCTLGGCFKYYHVDCVYKNKNVSCINSMKVSRFRCPLHYCEFCQASGDSVLIVQCVDCPIAYHLKCLSQDIKAIRLTKKYILCGKHNYDMSDFKKYEEKAQPKEQTIAKSSAIKEKRKKKKQKKMNKTLKRKNEDFEELESSPFNKGQSKSEQQYDINDQVNEIISKRVKSLDRQHEGSNGQHTGRSAQKETNVVLFSVEKKKN